MDFGRAAAQDFNGLRLRWFDHWLKGMDTGVMDDPPVRLFTMGVNRWRGEAAWPLPDTRYTPCYFRGGKSRSARSLNDGRLSFDGPSEAESPDSFVYDPEHPTPTRGGNTLNIPGGAFDQREVERGCLTYTSDPLRKDLDVTGPVTCVLHGMSSAPDTDWVARLSDVSPDGVSRNVCDGILRARYRDSRQHPSLLTPNQVYRYEVDLWATSNLFRAGHRIRVTVTSSNFPRFDRNLNTGGPCNEEARGRTAVNTLFHDAVRPSHIVLPVVER
jgi:putative CocE/NonD family hydrolase